MSDDKRTVWCGNLSDKVTEELLYELFLQAAPLERVRIPADREGRRSNFAFITMKHEISVDYAVQLLNGTRLFDQRLNVKRRNSNSTPNQNQKMENNKNNQASPVNVMECFSELFKMGQLMQMNYNNYIRDNNPGRFNHSNSPTKFKDDYKGHYKRDNYAGNSGRRGYNRKGNYHDDKNRRHRPY